MELPAKIEIENFDWKDSIEIEVYGIRSAVLVKMSLLRNIYIQDTEKISILHVETKANMQLLQCLTDNHRKGSIKLVSELWDRNAGKQIDMKNSHLYELDKDGRVNFLQQLVEETKINNCSSESVHLAVVARFYTYPAVGE